jgi:hypothetical protein
VKSRPILFSGPMIRALLAGTKTQTRRVVKPLTKRHPVVNLAEHGTCAHVRKYSGRFNDPDSWGFAGAEDGADMALADWPELCPYGKPGDLLWVRETWQHSRQRLCRCPQGSEPSPCDDWSNGTGCASVRGDVIYRADGESLVPWRPAIHMPRWASRLTLRITNVRVQRLQEISAEDVDAEGLGGDFPHKVWPHLFPDAEAAGALTIPQCYGRLWESINGPGSWGANPWAWALTFDVIKANVDQVREAA